jgi:hypothetical protein
MFRLHQKAIAAHAETAEGFRRVVRFVHLTIQEPLDRAPAFMRACERGDKRCLWGWKASADAWWSENYAEAFEACRGFAAVGDVDSLVAYLSQCPGLGFAKGGFVAQLAFGVSGCIDSHNLERFGIDPKIVAPRKVKRFETARKHAARYNAAVATLGGTEALWDSWCEFVAARPGYGKALGAFGVSALHCAALGIDV